MSKQSTLYWRVSGMDRIYRPFFRHHTLVEERNGHLSALIVLDAERDNEINIGSLQNLRTAGISEYRVGSMVPISNVVKAAISEVLPNARFIVAPTIGEIIDAG